MLKPLGCPILYDDGHRKVQNTFTPSSTVSTYMMPFW